ncbi:MAG: proton-conducting transporter membrane subunit [Dermatophilaceae bacterium]
MTPSAPVTLDWLVLAPALVPVAGLLLVLVLDAVLPGRRGLHLAVGVVALLAAAATAVPGALAPASSPALSLCLPGGTEGACFWRAGPLQSTLQVGVLAATLAVLLLQSDRWHPAGTDAGATHDGAVDVALLLGSATGGVAVAAAQDVATWLIALELATLPVVALVALRRTRESAHGALTLMMTSLLSFAILVVGAGLWVLATGGSTLTGAAVRVAWADAATRPVLVLAVLALIAGVGFKLSAVPFHAWTPPTFTSAPLPVTALLAAASKVAALAALLIVLAPLAGLVGAQPAPHAIAFVLGALALASMLVGTVLALRAVDVVRLLAWSTIAQAGWVLLPLSALTAAGHRAAAGYVLTYAAASLVAFAAVSAVRRTTGGEPGSGRELSAYTGLARTHPHVGGPLVLALLTFAGLPPGILGLVAKVVALRPLVGAGLWPLAVAAVVGVVLGIAVYLRWVAVLLGDPAGAEVERDVHLDRGALAVLALGSALLVVATVVPHVLYGLLS